MQKPVFPFVEFPKISRWSRGIIITEKIDGTNASVHIPEVGDIPCECNRHRSGVHSISEHKDGRCQVWSDGDLCMRQCDCTGYVPDQDKMIYAGSRTKWITPEDDNMGFARWVEANREELLKLGPGTHFGEWWGAGIQRKYGLKEKRFSLFNVTRWGDAATRPACCGVVPVLWEGLMDDVDVDDLMRKLKENGSHAVPGFMNPEGIVIFCVAGGQLFKKTFSGDEFGKGK